MVKVVLRNRIALWLMSCALVIGFCLQPERLPASELGRPGLSQTSGPDGARTRIMVAAEGEGRGKRYQWLLKERSQQEPPQKQSDTTTFFEKLDRDIKAARKLYLSGETENAILQYRSAVDYFESLVDEVPPGHPLLKELEQRLTVFEEMATKLLGPILAEIQEDVAGRLFHLMEKRRLCRLSISLKKAGNIEFFDVPASLLEDESHILRKLLEQRQDTASSGSRQIEEDLKSKLAEVRRSLQKSSTRYAALRRAQPPPLSELRRDVLRANELIIDINLLSDRMVAGIITKESAVYHQVPVNRVEIDAAVFNLQDQLREFASESSSTFLGHAWKEPCRRIHRALLGKLPPIPSEKSTVFIIPDRSLWYLPFPVMLDSEDRPFGQDRIISLIPSAEALRFIRTQGATHSASPDSAANLVLFESIPWIPDEDVRAPSGTGPLRKKVSQNESEGEKIERLILKNSVYPKPSEIAVGLQKTFKKSDVFVGPAATIDRFLEFKDRYEDIAVLAVPLSMSDSVGPNHQPSLFFSPDKRNRRRLEARGLFAAPLGARLVILPIAWFDVQDREALSGEGPLLFSSAVFYAGAPLAMVNYSDPNWGYEQPFVETVLKKASEGVSPGRTISSYPRELPAGLDSSFSGKPPSWAGWILMGDPGS